MDIKIDVEQVSQIIDQQATDSIKSAFSGYALRSTLEKAISDSVIPAIMTDAIVAAASQIDIAALTQHLAQEMARAVTKGVQAIVQDAMVEIILAIHKIPSYDDKARAEARAKVLHTVFGK